MEKATLLAPNLKLLGTYLKLLEAHLNLWKAFEVYLGGTRLMLFRIQMGIFSMQNIKNKLLHEIPCRCVGIVDSFAFSINFSKLSNDLHGFLT